MMAVSCMCNASDHNYKNSSVIVDLAVRQISRSAERISSYNNNIINNTNNNNISIGDKTEVAEVLNHTQLTRL